MISKIENINTKANPFSQTGNKSEWEKSHYQNTDPLFRVSFRPTHSQLAYLDNLVKEKQFLNRSEAIRYSIQFCQDLDEAIAGIITTIIEMKK